VHCNSWRLDHAGEVLVLEHNIHVKRLRASNTTSMSNGCEPEPCAC